MSIKIMIEVWENSPSTLGTRLVELALADSANEETRKTWLSVTTLSRKTRLGESTVHRAIKELEEMGRISVDERPGHSNMFTVNPVEGCQIGTPPPSKMTPQGSQNDTHNRKEPKGYLKHDGPKGKREVMVSSSLGMLTQNNRARLRSLLVGMGIECTFGWAGDAINTFGETEVIRVAKEARERIVGARKPTSYLWGILKKGQKDSGPGVGEENGDPIFDSL